MVANIQAYDADSHKLSADKIVGTTECNYTDEGVNYTVYNDTAGRAGSEYSIGFEMQENSDGSVNVQVGISNSDTGFATYAEYDGISADESSTDDGE